VLRFFRDPSTGRAEGIFVVAGSGSGEDALRGFDFGLRELDDFDI